MSSLAELLKRIESILTSDDASFNGLTRAAHLDPKTDFRGIYLNGLPLANADVRGFDFSGSDLRNTGVEKARRDDRTSFSGAIFDGPSLDPQVVAFNKRLRDASFSELESLLSLAVDSGHRNFDVISFTTAIRRSPRIERTEH
jgi:uncharacterized protein YjbI with pentapeptide repeats